MRKIILAASSALILSGCSDGLYEALCRQVVSEKYDTAEVHQLVDDDFKYVARTKDGDVIYAHCNVLNMNAKVVASSVIFKGK